MQRAGETLSPGAELLSVHVLLIFAQWCIFTPSPCRGGNTLATCQNAGNTALVSKDQLQSACIAIHVVTGQS